MVAFNNASQTEKRLANNAMYEMVDSSTFLSKSTDHHCAMFQSVKNLTVLNLKIGFYTPFIFYFFNFYYIAPHPHSQPGQEPATMASVLLHAFSCPSIRQAHPDLIPSHLSQFYHRNDPPTFPTSRF